MYWDIADCLCIVGTRALIPGTKVQDMVVWGFPTITLTVWGDPYDHEYGILVCILASPTKGN